MKNTEIFKTFLCELCALSGEKEEKIWLNEKV